MPEHHEHDPVTSAVQTSANGHRNSPAASPAIHTPTRDRARTLDEADRQRTDDGTGRARLAWSPLFDRRWVSAADKTSIVNAWATAAPYAERDESACRALQRRNPPECPGAPTTFNASLMNSTNDQGISRTALPKRDVRLPQNSPPCSDDLLNPPCRNHQKRAKSGLAVRGYPARIARRASRPRSLVTAPLTFTRTR
jgi:hypothetical protein